MTDQKGTNSNKDPYSYRSQPSPLAGAGKYMGLGLQFGGSIVLFMFGGLWLDKRLGTSPLFLIIGVFGGAAAAFYSMYRKLMADQRRDEESKK
jgi:ATP synthase protein I